MLRKGQVNMVKEVPKDEKSAPPYDQADGHRAESDQTASLVAEVNSFWQRQLKLVSIRGIVQYDYYSLLGLTSEADLETIKNAFRSYVKTFHPDKLISVVDNQSLLNQAGEITRLINGAWEVLGDSTKKAAYDQDLKNAKVIEPPPHGRPAQSPPRAGESEDNHTIEQLIKDLELAPNIRSIKEILVKLSGKDYVFTGIKSGNYIRRDPAIILSRIQDAEKMVESGTNDELNKAIGDVTAMLDIRSKVARELTNLHTVMQPNCSIDNLLQSLEALSKIDFYWNAARSGQFVKRKPADIIKTIEAVRAASSPTEVNNLIVNVTSLGDFDLKVYSELRSSWGFIDKLRMPVPDRLAQGGRFESYKKRLKKS